MRDDMYIDYGHGSEHVRRRKRRTATIIIILLAVVMGVGGYFGARYYINVMQDLEDSDKLREMGSSAAEQLEEQANGETGIYGLWYADNSTEAEEVSVYDNLDDEVWMPDFVDNRERVKVKGIYLSAQIFSKKVDEAIKICDETEINAIVVDIKSDYGYISYMMSDCALAKEAKALSNTIPDIEAFVKRCKEHNIYLIARIVTIKDPLIWKTRPDLCMTLNDGTLYKDATGNTWMNPYKDEVWDYVIDICSNCAKAGFDEVNLDYVRFSTERKYKEIDFGPEAEEMSKTEAITAGVKRVCEAIKPLGVFVSCDVFGSIISSSVDSKLVGQSYFQLSQYLDYICPMIYPSHYSNGYYNLDYPDCHPYELVYHALMDSRKVLYMIDDTGNKAEVRPWLQDFTATWVAHHLDYGKDEVRAQIDGVYDAGYSQWFLWNVIVQYSTGALEKEQYGDTD